MGGGKLEAAGPRGSKTSAGKPGPQWKRVTRGGDSEAFSAHSRPWRTTFAPSIQAC